MAWLVHDGRVLATLEIAHDRRARARGLLGRDGLDGALLLRPARSIHTFRMRFPIDVAYCDGQLRVLEVTTVLPNRLPRPRWRSRAVLETEAGVMGSWELRPGDRLEIKGDGADPDRPTA